MRRNELMTTPARSSKASGSPSVLRDSCYQVDPRVWDPLGGVLKGCNQPVRQVVGHGQQVSGVPVGLKVSKRSTLVLNQEMG